VSTYMKRHWLITLLAYASAAAAPLLLWSAFHLMRVRSAGNYVTPPLLHTWLWQIVGLFPTPSAISGLSVILPRAPGYEGYTAMIPLLITLQLIAAACSAALAYGLWRQLPWARPSMMIVCVLEIVVQIGIIFRYPTYPRIAVVSFLDLFRWIGPFLQTHGGRLATIGMSAFCLRFLIRYGAGERPADAASAVRAESAVVPEKAVASSRVAWLSALAIPALTIVLALVALGAENVHVKDFFVLLFWLVLLFLPYAVTAWRLWRGPDRFGLGFASGLGLVSVGALIASSPLILFGLLMAYGWSSQREKSSAILAGLLILVIAVVHLFLFIASVRASILLRGAGKASPAAWGVGFALPLLVVLVLPGLLQQGRYAGLSAKNGNLVTSRAVTYPGSLPEDLKRQKAAKTLVRAYARCAFAYSSAHPAEGFPPEAAKLGPGGTNCLDANQLAAHLDGYKFSYRVFSSPGAHRLDELHSLVLPEPPVTGSLAKQGFLVEETGQLRNVSMRAENATSAAKLVAESLNRSQTLGLLHSLSRCLNRVRFAGESDEYPQTLDKVLEVADPSTHAKCIGEYDLNGPEPISVSTLRANHFTSRGYALAYALERDEAGRATRYTLEARPVHYGEEEFRSYYVSSSGIIRYTPLDRAATSGDPEVPLCDLAYEACEISPEPVP
jgi:hypothetical protein